MYTKNKQPGRFESNASQLKAEILNNIILDGLADDTMDFGQEVDGYVDHYALILGKWYGWIVNTDNNGFVSILGQGTRQEAQEAWKNDYMPDYEQYLSELNSTQS